MKNLMNKANVRYNSMHTLQKYLNFTNSIPFMSGVSLKIKREFMKFGLNVNITTSPSFSK